MNGETEQIKAGGAVSQSFLGYIRRYGVSRIQEPSYFHCNSLNCDFRKVVCVVRRTQIEITSHGKITPKYPRCYNCDQGEEIELEIIRKLGRNVRRKGIRIKVISR